MSITFIIAPYGPDDWAKSGYSYTESIGSFHLDKEQFREGLKNRWPEVELLVPDSNSYALEWILPPSRPNFGGLTGRLSSSGQIVTMGTGPKESLIEFILWFRSFSQSKFSLYLFGSGYDDVLRLEQNATEQEIVAYTGLVD